MFTKKIILILLALVISGCSNLVEKSNIKNEVLKFKNEKEVYYFIKKYSETSDYDIAEEFYNSNIFIFELSNNEIVLSKNSSISGHFNENIYFSNIESHDYIKNVKLTKYITENKEVFEKDIDTVNNGTYLTLNIQNTFDNKKILELDFFESEIINMNQNKPKLVIKEQVKNKESIKEYSLLDFYTPVTRVIDISKDFIINNQEPFLVYKDNKIIIYMVVNY